MLGRNRNRSSGARLSLAPSRDSLSSDGSPVTFEDEENVIITVLIAFHDHILTNTASTGPTMEAKNKVWDMIRTKLCCRINAIQRTDEQVRNRWKTLRSSFSFKQDKAQHLAEMFYRRLPPTHKLRLEDLTVAGITFPDWLRCLIRNDPNFKPGAVVTADAPVANKNGHSQPAGAATSATSNGKSRKRPSTTPRQQPSGVHGKPIDTISNKRRKTFNGQNTSSTVKPEPHLVDQDAEHYLFKRILFPLEGEAVEQQKTCSSTPPSSLGQEELNSVTESGVNTPSMNCDDYETEVHANYRRFEELHQAKLALLHAKRREVDARMRFTELQMQAYLRQNAAVFEGEEEPESPLEKVNSTADDVQGLEVQVEKAPEAEQPSPAAAEQIVERVESKPVTFDEMESAEVPGMSANEPIDTMTSEPIEDE